MMKRCFAFLAALTVGVVFAGATAPSYGFEPGEEEIVAPENPEIDPGSMGSALTLLAGAGMLMADKLRKKSK
jgi:hypothetical protein